jgi:hypothetical protein
LGWVMVESPELNGSGDEQAEGRERGKVRQVLWNREASRIGLEGITVTMRYGERKGDDGGGLDGECVLMWKDRPIRGLSQRAGGEEAVE